MLKRTMLARSLLIAFSGTAALSGSVVFAQTTPAQPQELQRVEITGSNIRRTDAETASPVQIITKQEIDQSGKTTVAEYLQTLAVDNQGSVPTTFGSGFASGASGISLRGLGAASTLVLINGRRVAPYGLADDGQKVFADLNVIPLEAVERVEILKDGGSAIYGSDAMAGVVNIILRKSFNGTVLKGSYGQSSYRDGKDTRASITHGFGDLNTQGYNVLLNLELGKRDAIYTRDRAGRGTVGRSDLRPEGFDADTSGGANGGTGAIIAGGGAAVSSVVGNVRNPANNLYVSRLTGTACSTFTGGYPQGDPGGGCLIDAPQSYNQIQPESDTLNFFTRITKPLNASNDLYAEVNYYKSEGRSQTTPSGVSGSTGFPGGPVNNADIRLGAGHPDNPFASSARLRYLAADVGPRVSEGDSTFTRFVGGAKGSFGSWEYDTGVLFSENKTTQTRTGYLQRDVAFALLNPAGIGATNLSTVNTNAVSAALTSPAYAALPPGTLWRIGENAGLNSAAMYAALSPTISSDAKSRTAQIDFKVNGEVGTLPGGPVGVAVGTEFRRENLELQPTSGTERGNIIGLGYSAYEGARNVAAVYGEVVAPVTKQIELNAALRADRYSDSGNSYTPKFGVKWRPASFIALRGTYARAFRAPSPAENGVGGLAFFTSTDDPVRCALDIASACAAANVAGITSPNPNLEPEKAKSLTVGAVLDLTPKTSLTVDLWEIKRKNEINQESTTNAVAAGNVARDAGGSLFPGDPGPITAVLVNYINSAQSTVRGVDVDLKHQMDLASGFGRVNFGFVWTHLFKWERVERDGTKFEWAGTIGNHDVTNATGTPKDRVNVGIAWDMNRWRVASVINYRGALINKFAKDDADCATQIDVGGTLVDAPAGCKISSFTTVDLTARFKITDKTEIFGGVQNLLNKTPPLDPITYGAVSYNPLDYRGAVGRFYSLGLRHTF